MSKKKRLRKMYCLCQHSGSYGPWYHISVYANRADGEPWKCLSSYNPDLFGPHLNHNEATELAKRHNLF